MKVRKTVKFLMPIVLIASLIVVVILYASRNFTITKTQYETRLKETGEQLADGIELHMNTSVSFLEAMAEVFSEYDDIHSEEALDTLRRVSEKSDFTRMWLTKANGEAMSSEGSSSNATGRAYLESGLRGESGISEVQISIVNGEQNVVIYAPIYHNDTITGLVIGIYKLEELSQIIDVECFEGQGHCDIFRKNGDIIVYSENKNNKNQTNLLDYWEDFSFVHNNSIAEIKRNLDNGEPGIISHQYGEYYQYSYYCPVGINDWFVFVTLPENVVTKEFRENAFSAATLCVSFMIVLSAFLINNYQKKNKKLVKLAQTDSMTELLNRGAIEQSIDQSLGEYTSEKCILMLFDIDKFKTVNDTKGHIVGDLLLKKIAQLMSSEFRKIDILGRLGGDEFIIFIRDIEDEDVIISKAMDFLGKLRKLSEEGDFGIDISGSMGIAISPRDGKTFAQLYERADELMYKAKDSGGDCVITV